MDDRNQNTIVGRDADEGRGPQGTTGEGLAEQLNATTSEAAGGSVSGTRGEQCENLDIVFESEDPDD